MNQPPFRRTAVNLAVLTHIQVLMLHKMANQTQAVQK